jgi:3-hydroxyisobutyrate dehydrogenase-like beta-hydroxyacid dehydrogenase
MLLGGRTAAGLAPRLNALGLNTRFMSERVGVASAMKMCRSIMIKGLEALTVECLLAARRLGAEEAVLESLAQTYPSMGWRDGHDDYLVSRVAEHGRRRAAEMREVVATLESIGHEPSMAAAIASRQLDLVDRMAAAGIRYPRDGAFSWRELADALERVT